MSVPWLIAAAVGLTALADAAFRLKARAALGIGLLLLTVSLAFAFPILALLPLAVTAWFCGMQFMLDGHRGRLNAESASRRLRRVRYLAVGLGVLIAAVSLPAWLDWGRLHLRGGEVRAAVVGAVEEQDHDADFGTRTLTRVTYEFDAEAAGRPHRFRRLGTLRGRYLFVPGFVRVVYDPTDPARSRMTREFPESLNEMVGAAGFLAIGVALYLLSRRPWRSPHAPPSPGAPA